MQNIEQDGVHLHKISESFNTIYGSAQRNGIHYPILIFYAESDFTNLTHTSGEVHCQILGIIHCPVVS